MGYQLSIRHDEALHCKLRGTISLSSNIIGIHRRLRHVSSMGHRVAIWSLVGLILLSLSKLEQILAMNLLNMLLLSLLCAQSCAIGGLAGGKLLGRVLGERQSDACLWCCQSYRQPNDILEVLVDITLNVTQEIFPDVLFRQVLDCSFCRRILEESFASIFGSLKEVSLVWM